MLYSKTTNAFYSREINGNSIPTDAIEISDATYQEMMLGQSEGKQIVSDANGYPVLIVRQLTLDQQLSLCKEQGKLRLANTDWSQQADVREQLVNTSQFDEYRMIVRGIFLSPVPNPSWPDEPTAEWRG